MHIEMACAHCDNLLKLRPEYIGRRVRCPKCNKVFRAQEVPVLELEVVEEPEPKPEEPLIIEIVEEPRKEPISETPITRERKEGPLLLDVSDSRPDYRPPSIDVRIAANKSGIYRLFLKLEELQLIFITFGRNLDSIASATKLAEKVDRPQAREERRISERLFQIQKTPFSELKNDHKENFRIDLDEVYEATIIPIGFWYRLLNRPRSAVAILTLWHPKLGKQQIEIGSNEDLKKVIEILPRSLGKRLKIQILIDS
jgi:hypothetical protein